MYMFVDDISQLKLVGSVLCVIQRRFFTERRISTKNRAALAASRAKYLLASKSASKTTAMAMYGLPPINESSSAI